MDNVEDLKKQIAKLDRIMAKSLQRRGEIEQILFDVATGKLPPPSPQDCRVLALKLGTDKADWPEQIANHVWQGNTERDALAAQVKELKSELRQEKLIHIGFTNESQVQYVTEDKEEGAFYPNSDHGCYIPVYMLNVHAHRVGSESKIYCTQLEQGKKIAEIRAEAVKEFARKLGDALILPHSLRKETQKAEFYKAGWRDAFLFANQYADNIRQEAE